MSPDLDISHSGLNNAADVSALFHFDSLPVPDFDSRSCDADHIWDSDGSLKECDVGERCFPEPSTLNSSDDSIDGAERVHVRFHALVIRRREVFLYAVVSYDDLICPNTVESAPGAISLGPQSKTGLITRPTYPAQEMSHYIDDPFLLVDEDFYADEGQCPLSSNSLYGDTTTFANDMSDEEKRPTRSPTGTPGLTNRRRPSQAQERDEAELNKRRQFSLPSEWAFQPQLPLLPVLRPLRNDYGAGRFLVSPPQHTHRRRTVYSEPVDTASVAELGRKPMREDAGSLSTEKVKHVHREPQLWERSQTEMLATTHSAPCVHVHSPQPTPNAGPPQQPAPQTTQPEMLCTLPQVGSGTDVYGFGGSVEGVWVHLKVVHGMSRYVTPEPEPEKMTCSWLGCRYEGLPAELYAHWKGEGDHKGALDKEARESGDLGGAYQVKTLPGSHQTTPPSLHPKLNASGGSATDVSPWPTIAIASRKLQQGTATRATYSPPTSTLDLSSSTLLSRAVVAGRRPASGPIRDRARACLRQALRVCVCFAFTDLPPLVPDPPGYPIWQDELDIQLARPIFEEHPGLVITPALRLQISSGKAVARRNWLRRYVQRLDTVGVETLRPSTSGASVERMRPILFANLCERFEKSSRLLIVSTRTAWIPRSHQTYIRGALDWLPTCESILYSRACTASSSSEGSPFQPEGLWLVDIGYGGMCSVLYAYAWRA
ncbi:uncharacterized protein B0H18DRAFT_1128537 [Fomitopsis serialis]|uniref:uncharacterized protein n=1 Tax=Fomitopsis serialis TaxID=139415 RepID=UPI0020081933|nr:uncharacterized protein B0H18DRAFT_1128537 [Neoantrodia serialis]KAH9911549.1 hypothetical protein B0H18DRAFT_1128537 [Neoantrodia serialis]